MRCPPLDDDLARSGDEADEKVLLALPLRLHVFEGRSWQRPGRRAPVGQHEQRQRPKRRGIS